MNRSRRPMSAVRVLIVLGASALLLAACGRKGPLELPANSPPAPQMSAAPTDTTMDNAAKPGVFNSGYGTDGAPAAPRGQKKPFILDPLLDSK
ncbi:LPS translocon maturation chaperone LptM [Bradyrhizobium sp. HKCCYLS2038]|uniref:LPS translocon maturation chaperone LptM n=1 Tax=unclassified Bradyrhizobium TaxID=2631580 RepID=UPI003EBE9AC5